MDSFGKTLIMEKIVLVIDSMNANPHSLDFACYLAGLTDSKVTGVFLENLVANEKLVLQEMHGRSYVEWAVDKNSQDYKDKMETIERNIGLFKDACEKRSVRYSIRRDSGDPAKEIIAESRYADLIVLDAETSCSNRFEGIPTELVKKVLIEAECPVVIAPESFDGIDEIVFTYNGSKSSIYAIKQFSYLFPQLDDKKVKVLEVDNNDAGVSKEEIEKFREWISGHYSSIGFETLKGDAETELFASLFKKENLFIVMGAYGRTALSRFFKRSPADLLLKTITQAFFIAHN
jgi:hypothetical protein